MGILVHHQPADRNLKWTLHYWQGSSAGDVTPVDAGQTLDFTLPDNLDPRKVRFKYYSTDTNNTHLVTWEPDDYVRIIRLQDVTEIWTYEASGRVLYAQPAPPNVHFDQGNTLTFNLITENRLKEGRMYLWNPYDPSKPEAYIDQSSRDEANKSSTFTFSLASWMTNGFHFKFMRNNYDGKPYWESESSNRVWRPVDGSTVWCKSGQVSVRKEALALVDLPVEMLLPNNVSAPDLSLVDPVEDLTKTLVPSVKGYPGSEFFKIACYSAPIYPNAAYSLLAPAGYENPAILRPFPADPENPPKVSRFALGVDGWLDDFPPVTETATIVVEPRPDSSFPGEELSVQVALGSAAPYLTVHAEKKPDGSWQAILPVTPGLKTSVQLQPAVPEHKLYDWIDTARFFIPYARPMTMITTEGVYGWASAETSFADPPDSRQSIMKAAFGKAAAAGVFDPVEMPHGATRFDDSWYYFVIHAPHAVIASLVLVDERASGGPTRCPVPMSLTRDGRYWWCKIEAAKVAPGTRYRFALNDTTEVIDPAAREIIDKETWETSPQDDPGDPKTTWSLVIDVDAVRATAQQQPWDTMGWEALVVYEIHAKRFTDLSLDGLPPLEVLADELKPQNRRGEQGYLARLPVTALELLPVHEFRSSASWGYNPACYFAIDSSYGGAKSMAIFTNQAHQSGRAVMLDLVYNHSLDSPLMKVARDVYRNGDAYGDRMNCGHPMVLEFLRQATIYIWRTFGIDGFRLDDTKTVVTGCLGGWQFLGKLRDAVRAAAAAEGKRYPIFIAENDPKTWDMANPGWSIVDGEWNIDEVYRIRDTTYATWHDGTDNAGDLKGIMDSPAYWGRPFYIATRYGESHDAVSGQDPSNARIARRPPFRQGLQMSKAMGAVTLMANGIPMMFMGQEVGETRFFSFDNDGPVTNPQVHDLEGAQATDNTRVLEWFRSLAGLRRDPAKGLQGNDNYQIVSTGRRTVAFSCGRNQELFTVVTFGTPDQRQDSSWLGLPDGSYKEIFNSSWPCFQVEFEQEQTNGGYGAQIGRGTVLKLPWIGAVVLERR